jgi:hypothetical protein
MVSVGIIGNADKETIIEVLGFLKKIPDFRIVYVKQSDKKLYVVTDRIFNQHDDGGDNDFNGR